MVIAFIINQTRLVVILDNFRIGGINNMAAIAGENAVILKFVGSDDTLVPDTISKIERLNILVSGNLDSGILETDIPEEGNSLIGLFTTY